MEKTKTIDQSGTVIEVKISDLRITSEDPWMDKHIEKFHDSVSISPHYRYLNGTYHWIAEWTNFRKLDKNYITWPLMLTLQSLIKEGQLEPIKIYKDMRINTGHKRAACMLFLGYETIKAIIVPDDTKL